MAKSNTENILLSVKNLYFKSKSKTLLENINFDIKNKEIITLIGPNGAGKTTLAKAIIGITKAHSGSITRSDGLVIGYVPQYLHINSFLPINVEQFLSLACSCSSKDISNALKEVEAEQLINEQMKTLSGGEFQRVLLARAIIRKPNLLILDEPVKGMDLDGQSKFYQRIKDIRDKLNCAVLMISHDLHMVMAASDRVICLNRHICCAGHPEHITNDPEFTELFGKGAAEIMAVYTHHHDHSHGWNKRNSK